MYLWPARIAGMAAKRGAWQDRKTGLVSRPAARRYDGHLNRRLSRDMTFEIAATPEAAVDRLEALYSQAKQALCDDLQRFFTTQEPPTPEERALYRYPMLRVTYEPSKLPAATRRGYAKFAMPGVYSTTVTHPAEFRAYLLDQLRPLVEEYGATIETGVSAQEIPYPYALDGGDELGRGKVSPAELARHFPTPLLSLVGDEVADGSFDIIEGEPRPLSLFDAVRVDYSLRRLVHYTGRTCLSSLCSARSASPPSTASSMRRCITPPWSTQRWSTRSCRSRRSCSPS